MTTAQITTIASGSIGAAAAVLKKVTDNGTFVATSTIRQDTGKIYSRRLLLQGAIAAVKACDEPVLSIVTDDPYLQMVCRNARTWVKNGGMTNGMKDPYGNVIELPHAVKNWDLITALLTAIDEAGIMVTVEQGQISQKVIGIVADLLSARDEISKSAPKINVVVKAPETAETAPTIEELESAEFNAELDRLAEEAAMMSDVERLEIMEAYKTAV